MFAIWANICWLSCCSLGSMAWLLHQSVWWLGFPCMQMWDAFISLLLFSPAMAELTLCSDVSPNAWCPFISLHSWVLLFCWRIVLLLLLIVLRTSMAIIYSTSIFWKFFFFFYVGEWFRPGKVFFHQCNHFSIYFIFNYLDLGMYHPECTINAAPTEILLRSRSSKFCFTQGFSTLLSFFFFLCYLDSLAINDLPLS